MGMVPAHRECTCKAVSIVRTQHFAEDLRHAEWSVWARMPSTAPPSAVIFLRFQVSGCYWGEGASIVTDTPSLAPDVHSL